MSSAIFRILTGVHAGAEIELAEGTWVFGRDDSADVILVDKGIAPRHAAFTVDAHGVVRVEMLDGTVTPALGEPNTAIGTENASGTILRAGELLRLGTILFTWGAPEAPDAFWEGVEQELKTHFERLDRAAAPASAHAKGEKSEVPKDADSGEASSSGTSGASDASEEKASAESRSAHEVRASGSKILEVLVGVVLVLLFLAAVTLANDAWRARALGGLEAISPEGAAAVERWAAGALGGKSAAEADAARLARVEAMLREANLTEVRAEQAGRAIRFTGTVADDAARGRLLALARTLDLPALLDVSVESDRVEPLLAAFSTLGFHPEVRIVKETAETKDGKTEAKDAAKNAEEGEALRVSGYMLSGAVEEKAFLEALRLVPALSGATSPRIERRIRHQSDVEPLIRKALEERGLKAVEVEYLPGSIRLRTILTPERADALKGAVDAVRAACDVPLAIEIANEAPAEKPNATAAKSAATAAPAKPAKATASKPATSGGPDFKVTSVSSGAIPFVTLATGERVFAGGRLPGGYTLEAIRSDRLVLSKNGRRTEYRLEIGAGTPGRKTGNNH